MFLRDSKFTRLNAIFHNANYVPRSTKCRAFLRSLSTSLGYTPNTTGRFAELATNVKHSSSTNVSGCRKQVILHLTRPISARTCSDLVIENKSHPASNETPLSSKCSNPVIDISPPQISKDTFRTHVY